MLLCSADLFSLSCSIAIVVNIIHLAINPMQPSATIVELRCCPCSTIVCQHNDHFWALFTPVTYWCASISKSRHLHLSAGRLLPSSCTHIACRYRQQKALETCKSLTLSPPPSDSQPVMMSVSPPAPCP